MYVSIYLSIFLSIYIPTYLPTYLPIHSSTNPNPIHLFNCPCIHFTVCMSVCLFTYLPTYPSIIYIYLSIHPYIHPPTNPPLHPSIYLSIFQPTYIRLHPSIHTSIYLPTHPPTESVNKMCIIFNSLKEVNRLHRNMYLGGARGISISMLISTEGLGIPTTIPKTSFPVSVLGAGEGVMNGAI